MSKKREYMWIFTSLKKNFYIPNKWSLGGNPHSFGYLDSLHLSVTKHPNILGFPWKDYLSLESRYPINEFDSSSIFISQWIIPFRY